MSAEEELATLRLRRSAKWRVFPDDVLPAWVAEMDFALAEPISRALTEAVGRSDTGYMYAGDVPAATAEFAQRAWSWQIDPAQVVTVPDVVTGIAIVLEAFTPPGSGVIVNTPVYPPFFTTIERVAGRTVVDVPLACDAQGRYCLDLDGIAKAFARPEVSAFLLCSPHNPTGTVPTRPELMRIAELAARHDVLVVADEIHAPLTLPGIVHTPYLAVAGTDQRVASVISASKAWNTAGLKCAQVVMGTAADAERLVAQTPAETLFGTGLFGVLATIAAYREGGPWLEEVRGVIAGNAALVDEVLTSQVPQIGYQRPEATYLAWLDLRATSIGADPAAALLERGRLAVNDGRTFGANGAGFIRLNLGTTPAVLSEALARIARVVAE